MTNIYDQHRAAFSNVAAYVVVKDGYQQAKIAFKFPKDGAGRLWVYVHYLGRNMVRACVSGYGYDKQAAALAKAATLINATEACDPEKLAAFVNAIGKDDGHSWDYNLRGAGFDIYNAV